MIVWSGEIINVISVGATSYLQLSAEALQALQQADVIFGAEHQFDKLGEQAGFSAERVDYPRPWSDMAELLESQQTKKIVLLASGDALFFGLGKWLLEQVGQDHCRFFSNVSSIQAAFALLKKPWDSAQIISLHGRPMAGLRSRLRSNRLYGILTDDKNSPLALAKELLSLGYEQASIWVIEAMNDPAQRIRQFSLKQLLDETDEFHSLNICILETGVGSSVFPDFPGFSDALFAEQSSVDGSAVESGMFTKREVRLAILSLIQPRAGEVGWDVGAGFGSVCVEWARWQPFVTIHAVENHSARIDILKQNVIKFGVADQVRVCKGLAPGVLQNLPSPDVVYIGGSQGGIEYVMDYCWRRLSGEGRLVVSAVTEMTKARLIHHVETKYLKHHQIEWTEIAVSKGRNMAGRLILQPRLPVLLLSMCKHART